MKVHHVPEIEARKRNKTKYLILMILQIIPQKTTRGVGVGMGQGGGMGHLGLTMEKQKQTNLFALDILFYLWHIETHFENKPKNPIHNESTYDLLKLKSALSRKSKYLFIYPLFTSVCNTS